MAWFVRGRGGLLGLVFVGLVGASRPAAANHCYDCNEGLPTDVLVATPEVPLGGVVVLVLDDAQDRALDPSWWDGVAVAVFDADGNSVEGALETSDGFSPAAWRPAGPWVAGSYSVHIDVERGEGPEGCVPLSVAAEFTVSEEERQAPADLALVTEETYELRPTPSLWTWVCCDGALPRKDSVAGILCPGDSGTQLVSGSGFCTEKEGTGWLRVEAQLLADGDPVSADVLLRERTRGVTSESGAGLMVSMFEPSCFEFEALDLVTGEQSVFETCHGDSIADELGAVELDPWPGLTAGCEGKPFVCEVVGERWDPEACTTWPEGEPFVHPATFPDEVPTAEGESDEQEPSEPDGELDGAAAACTAAGFRPDFWPLWAVVLLVVARKRDRIGGAAGSNISRILEISPRRRS